MHPFRPFHFVLLFTGIFLLIHCDKSPPEKDRTEDYVPSVAHAECIRGQCLTNSRPLSGRTLLSPGDKLSTGEGFALVTHENGVRIHLLPNASLVQERHPAVSDGSVWVEFPAGIAADFSWKEWSIRGQDAIVEIADDQEPVLRVISGEILAVLDGSRHLVKAGHLLRLGHGHSGNDAQATGQDAVQRIQPLRWWQSTAGGLEFKPEPGMDLVPGQGVLGARNPGDLGKAHIPLVITSMDVNVRILGDLAVTEVTQEFLNPTRNTLEGIYRFGAPEHALVTGFAVDRDGRMVFGKIKGKEMARTQYESHVYAGSREDPALLEWEEEGRYRASIYPIPGGSRRKVFIRYTTWLSRMGEGRDRRMYSLPMLGADGLSPEIGEFSLTVQLKDAGARTFRANLGLFVEGERLRKSASDFQTTSDLHVELLDDGLNPQQALGWYDRPAGRDRPSVQRGDHAMIRLRPFTTAEELSRKLHLAILVDVSADTTPAQFQMSRSLVENLMASLQPGDKVTIVSGDTSLRKANAFVTIGQEDPVPLLEHLSSQKKGGATDLSGLLEEAAGVFSEFIPGTSPVLLYVGNGVPTVGILDADLIARTWAELPVFVAFRAVAIADGPGLDILTRLAGDVPPLKVTEPGDLRLLSPWMNQLRRPQLRNAEVDFDRAALLQPYPRGRFTVQPGEDLVVVGHASTTQLPSRIVLRGQLDGQPWERSFPVSWGRFTQGKELPRRWAYHRLLQYIQDNASPEELLDLGLRYELVTPFTSLYVPTAAEAALDDEKLQDQEDAAEMEEAKGDRLKREEVAEAPAERGPRDTRTLKTFGAMQLSADSAPSFSAPAPEPMPTTSVPQAPGSAPAPVPPPRPARPGRPRAITPEKSRDQPVVTGEARPFAGGTGIEGSDRTSGRQRREDPRGAREKEGGRQTPAQRGLDGYRSAPDSDISGLSLFQSNASELTKLAENTLIICHDCSISRQPSPCSALSKLPLWQRVGGWRERLAGANPWRVMELFQDAIRQCEAPTAHARMLFLRSAVSVMPTIQVMVEFYKLFVPEHGFSDLLRTAILARITKVEDILYVRRHLGLGTTLERVKIEEMLEKATNASERMAILQKLRLASPEDPWLTMRLLRIFETESMFTRADELVQRLFGNPLLDDELRLEAVEYALRRDDNVRARRLLSEIVEFAPSNPGRRRMLGQLYRAFGWKELAVREFLSYSALVQNSIEARLYLADAYEDTGEFEKSLGLVEEILTSGDPGSDPVKLARFFGCLFLARMRMDAATAIRQTILNRGRMMALFRDDEAVKILLTHKHPKADLEFLWGPSLEDLGRVPFVRPAFGLQAAVMAKLPSSVFLRVERADADSLRPLEAEILIILQEGTDGETLFKKAVTFEKGKKQITLQIAGNQITVVSEK